MGFELEYNYVVSISQKILESEQGNFFNKLVAQLPKEERLKIIAESPEVFPFISKTVRALMSCANCEKKERSKKEFKKCLGCNSVYYCSKACQKAHWSSHKKCANK